MCVALPADVVLVEAVTVLLFPSLKTAVTFIVHHVPGLREVVM